jgi:hypothetical protein
MGVEVTMLSGVRCAANQSGESSDAVGKLANDLGLEVITRQGNIASHATYVSHGRV